MIDKVQKDDLIAGGLGVVGVYAFYIAYTDFSFEEGIFPMIASGVMIVSVVMWLLRPILPDFMHAALIEYEEPERFEELSDETESVNHQPDDLNQQPDETGITDAPALVPLIGITIGFVGLSYLTGFLWATPAFIAVYGKYRAFEPRNYLIVGGVSFAVVLAFAYFTNTPVDEGLLWGYSI